MTASETVAVMSVLGSSGRRPNKSALGERAAASAATVPTIRPRLDPKSGKSNGKTLGI